MLTLEALNYRIKIFTHLKWVKITCICLIRAETFSIPNNCDSTC